MIGKRHNNSKVTRAPQPQLRNSSGQGMVEYLIVVVLVAVGSIAVVRILGETVRVKFAQVAQGLGAKVDGSISNPTVTETSYDSKDMGRFLDGATKKGN